MFLNESLRSQADWEFLAVGADLEMTDDMLLLMEGLVSESWKLIYCI
jgi:hypothetical protein